MIPDRAYDCLLLPNTLPHFRELDRCLAHALRVVRPGGTILASAAGLLPLTGDVPDYWRLTPDGWREKLARGLARRRHSRSPATAIASRRSRRSSDWRSRS